MSKSPQKKRNALGKGLGALLADTPSPEQRAEIVKKASGSINEIPVDAIEVNPFQPRTDFDEQALNELAESIKIQGIIQPITVRELEKGRYQLISGERRTQASRRAGLEKIPAYIRIANDQQMLEMALIENIQRENLNAIEIALSYQRLMAECELKQEELGDRVGKNRTTVNNYLRLLKLPPDIQAGLRDGKISMGHARALITIESIDHQLDIFKKIVQEDLSVRKVEELVRSLNQPQKPKPQKPEDVSPEIKTIQNKLSSHFGTKVTVASKDNRKGNITIPFTNPDDLSRILDLIEGL
ncbi:ParB/RepB/Spo0J family partition protein [Marinigracilibium pacificum]|uniref:ParB/RepB/Spo0J family partition protein n=1 Tax=Marinigracilibium pacificum TaxID=2729599 RepID=A0A848J7Y5_9BACT|nr:ParB/RepB/Spo0J family partition protein [Marinigracilibium pacificum]NMM50600.1 ParB/RepB/Spo0J family partition protein [Marinigracilibium pacificum]